MNTPLQERGQRDTSLRSSRMESASWRKTGSRAGSSNKPERSSSNQNMRHSGNQLKSESTDAKRELAKSKITVTEGVKASKASDRSIKLPEQVKELKKQISVDEHINNIQISQLQGSKSSEEGKESNLKKKVDQSDKENFKASDNQSNQSFSRDNGRRSSRSSVKRIPVTDEWVSF